MEKLLLLTLVAYTNVDTANCAPVVLEYVS